jgi:hypothetical protein
VPRLLRCLALCQVLYQVPRLLLILLLILLLTLLLILLFCPVLCLLLSRPLFLVLYQLPRLVPILVLCLQRFLVSCLVPCPVLSLVLCRVLNLLLFPPFPQLLYQLHNQPPSPRDNLPGGHPTNLAVNPAANQVRGQLGNHRDNQARGPVGNLRHTPLHTRRLIRRLNRAAGHPGDLRLSHLRIPVLCPHPCHLASQAPNLLVNQLRNRRPNPSRFRLPGPLLSHPGVLLEIRPRNLRASLQTDLLVSPLLNRLQFPPRDPLAGHLRGLAASPLGFLLRILRGSPVDNLRRNRRYGLRPSPLQLLVASPAHNLQVLRAPSLHLVLVANQQNNHRCNRVRFRQGNLPPGQVGIPLVSQPRFRLANPLVNLRSLLLVNHPGAPVLVLAAGRRPGPPRSQLLSLRVFRDPCRRQYLLDSLRPNLRLGHRGNHRLSHPAGLVEFRRHNQVPSHPDTPRRNQVIVPRHSRHRCPRVCPQGLLLQNQPVSRAQYRLVGPVHALPRNQVVNPLASLLVSPQNNLFRIQALYLADSRQEAR